MIVGLLVLLLAGILQGIFVLPLAFTRHWKWEHSWFMFSFWGMIFLNWLLGFYLFPHALSLYSRVPLQEVCLLSAFGLCWGIGAILFGLGMDKLGMSVGYPVIMGLIAAAGTLLPLLLHTPESIFTIRGIGIALGCGLVILAIVLCSRAATARGRPLLNSERNPDFGLGMLIAISAGLLSALPNIGITFADKTIHQAVLSGIPPEMAGNLVWLLFFTIGFIANATYTIYEMLRHHSVSEFSRSITPRNMLLTFLAAACWIGSFYLYGYAANRLGRFGAISAWPIFIAIAIVSGNLAGLWKGEWRNATPFSMRLLRAGIGVLLLAVCLIILSNYLSYG